MRYGEAQSLLTYHERLRSRDQNWASLREELAELFLPNRQGFLGDDYLEGDEKMDRVLSSAPLMTRRGLATAVSMMLRPAGRQWFGIQAMDDRLNMLPSVRIWCETVSKICFDMIYDPRAHMEANLSQADDDLVTFGDALVRVGWNKQAKHLQYRTHSLNGAYFIRNAVGEVDGVVIEYPDFTLRQVIEKFGEDRLTAGLKAKLSGTSPDMEQKVPLLHSVLPRADAERLGLKVPRQFEYCSVWTSLSCKEHLDVGGYYEFPYLTPGWDRSAGEVYSRSPAMVALNDARLLQAVTEDFIEAGHLALRPPTYSVTDTINGPLQLYAGGHTHIDMTGVMNGRGEPIGVIQMGGLPNGISEFMQGLVQSIGSAFYRDILRLPSVDTEKMTAAEINARMDEFMREAAPVFSRIEHNYNSPHVTRVYAIAEREGMLPDPPPELQGQPLKFSYESPIKNARDKAEALKIIEGVNYILPAAQAFPEILDNFNPDAFARMTAAKLDLPEHLFKPVEEVMQMRAERAKKMKMAEMAELASKAGPAIAQMGRLIPESAKAGLIPTGQGGLPLPPPEINYEDELLGASQLLSEELMAGM